MLVLIYVMWLVKWVVYLLKNCMSDVYCVMLILCGMLGGYDVY